MKKLVVSLFLAVLLLILTQIPAFAVEYIQTDSPLTQTEKANVQNSAESLKQKFGIDVLFAQEESDASAKELAQSVLESNNVSDSYFIYALTSEYYYCDWSSDLDSCFYEGDIDYILESIIEYKDDTYGFCSQYYSVMSRLLESRLSTPYKYVRDLAGVLTDEEENSLNEKLTKLRDKYKFDIVAVTSNGVQPGYRMAFADDYYDYNGYGYGKDKDGVLLLVNIGAGDTYSTGNSWVSTCGKGLDYIDDDAIEKIGEKLTPLLLDGAYSTALDTFADVVVNDISSYKFTNILIILAVTLVLALISGFIYAGKLKRQLISVAAAADANNYIVNGSLKISRSYDHYLYSNVTRTERQSSSSGSDSHTSSSGSTHGGGGF